MKNYYECISCGGTKYRKYEYDNHLGLRSYLNPKSIARVILHHIDFIIPKSVPSLKRVSSTKKRVLCGHVLVCSNCGYGVMNKPPSQEELEALYRNHYWSLTDLEATDPDDYRKSARAITQLQFVSHYLYKKRLRNILEIGAGSAYASQLLRENCKEAEIFVCEPGEVWGKYYTERKICRVAKFFPFKSKIKFDYIHTSHWLEHVINLENTMISLRELLSQKGLIFIEVPNTEHDYWTLPHGKTPDTPHIHFFTRRSLENIFKKFSFNCVKIGEFGNTFKEAFFEGVNVEYFGPNKKGWWIRALFEKSEG